MPLIVSILKITWFQLMAISFDGMPSMRFVPVAHVIQHLSEGRSVPRHLESDIETFEHPQFASAPHGPGVLVGSTAASPPSCAPVPPDGIRIGNHHVPRRRMAHHCRRHNSDRSRAGNQNILAEHWKRQRRMYRVAKGSKIAATS